MLEGYENINVNGGGWFEIERRAHRSADSVSPDHAVGLHLIDDCQRGFHGFPRFSMTTCFIPPVR
jgi:hypothetical protein